MPGLDGLLLLDKQPGYTSHDAVRRARHALRERRIGHCGTLDPEATGLLLLTVGRATRLARFLLHAPKVYVGTIHLGTATDTYDAAGTVVARAAVPPLTLAAAAAAMSAFEGLLLQTPPPYCAKKVNGQRYYELARRGEEVPSDPKEVEVSEFRPTALDGAALGFRLACASGTYARSLAHDLGRALGCGAHLSRLRRLRIASHDVADAVTPERLDEQGGEVAGLGPAWIPLDAIPLPFASVCADQQQERRIRFGQTVLVPQLDGGEGDWVRLINQQRELIAVGTVVERLEPGATGVVQPKIVFKQ